MPRRQSARSTSRGQPVWAATCRVTSLGSGTTAEVARLEPDIRMARWNREFPWLTYIDHEELESESEQEFKCNDLTMMVLSDTDRRQEKETREGGTSSVTHQSYALWVAPKLTNVFLQQVTCLELRTLV